MLKGSLHRRVLTKEDIGQPSNFRHIAHNGQILIDESTSAQGDTAQGQQPIDNDVDSEHVFEEIIHSSVLVHEPKTFLKKVAPLPPIKKQTNTSPANKSPAAPHILNKDSNNLSRDQNTKLTPNRKAPPPPRPPPPKFTKIPASSSTTKKDINNTTQTVSNILKMTAAAAFTFINNNPVDEAAVNNIEASNDQSGVTSSNNTSESTHSVHADSVHEYNQLDQVTAISLDSTGDTESDGTRQDEENLASEGLGVLDDLDAFLLRNSVGDDLNECDTDTNTPPEYLSLIDPYNDLCTVIQPENNEGTDITSCIQDSACAEVLSTDTPNSKQAECKTQLTPPYVLPRLVLQTNNDATPCSQECHGMIPLSEFVPTLVIEKSPETDFTISSDSNNIIQKSEKTKSEDFEYPKMSPDNVEECCQAENCEVINITDNGILLKTAIMSFGNDVEIKNLSVETICDETVQTVMEKECREYDEDIVLKTDVPTKVFTEEVTHSLRDDVTPSTSESQVSLSTLISTHPTEETKNVADFDSPRPSVLSWNRESCFRLEDIQDQELKLLLEKAGVSNEEMEDPGTRDFIYDFIQQHGGKQAVKKEALLLADVTASPSRRLRTSKKNKEGCKQKRHFEYNLHEENEEIHKVGDATNESSDAEEDDTMSTYL